MILLVTWRLDEGDLTEVLEYALGQWRQLWGGIQPNRFLLKAARGEQLLVCLISRRRR
jgi:hypothetical protein